MANNPVNWFEIPTTDLSRAQAFYEAVFAITLTAAPSEAFEMAFFPMEMHGPGAGGALVHHEAYTPSHDGTVIYFSVADIEATLARVVAAGGTVLLPKMAIGEHGFIAHFEDTEGNRLALHSM